MNEQLIERTKAAIEAQRQDEDALTLYWECIRAETKSDVLPEAYRLLYTIWSVQEDQSETLDTLIDTACQRHLSDVAILTMMAHSEFLAQRDDNALKLYDRLLRLNALDPKAYHNLKTACFRRQLFDEFANLLLQQCLTLHPDDQAIVRFLFSRYLLDDKYTYTPTAPGIYQKILEIEPDNLTARCKLSECYYRQGHYDKAIAEAEMGLEYNKHHPDILAILAKAHYKTEEYGKVVTYCRDILEKRPGRADIQVLLAEVYARNALTTNEAIKVYQLALEYDPDNLPVHLALFRAYMRKLFVDEAIQESEYIFTALHNLYEPSSPDFRKLVKRMLEEYERAIRRSPGDVTLYLVTAQFYESIGYMHKALIYYRSMLELPLSTEIIYKLIELLEKLATLTVQNPRIYLYLGLLYHKIQRSEEAKLAFRVAMFADLDEREIDDILVQHDRSIWQYPPVLVILTHHRIVTKDILEGLVQTLRQPDQEDWKGAIWALQELYDLDDVLLALRQTFTWENFHEIVDQIIPIFANNGSLLAIQLLEELLSHRNELVRSQAINALRAVQQPLAEQTIAEASRENPYPDTRLEIAQHYAQQSTEQTTYYLLNMLHDEDKNVRLSVLQALQNRDIQTESLREVLFTEQDPDVKIEIIKFFEQAQNQDESVYLAHLLNDLIAKRYSEGSHSTGKVYSTLKKLIRHSEDMDQIRVLSTLIQTLGTLRVEQAIYSLITVINNDSYQPLRIEAVNAIGQIGSQLGVTALQTILHTTSESQDLRTAAEQALDQIVIGEE